MLDELKSKARRDEKLRAELLRHERMHSLSAHSAGNAVNWAMRFTIWILSQLEKNFTLLCAEVPMVEGKTPRCWRVRMIFTSCFLRDWSKL